MSKHAKQRKWRLHWRTESRNYFRFLLKREVRVSEAEWRRFRAGETRLQLTNQGVQVWEDGLLVRTIPFTAIRGRAEGAMEWCEAIFPRHVAREEMGDALELIERWKGDPSCSHLRAKIVVKVFSTVIVMVFNSIRFVVSSIAGRKAE